MLLHPPRRPAGRSPGLSRALLGPFLPNAACRRTSEITIKRKENGRAQFQANARPTGSAAKLRFYEPSRRVHGHHENVIKQLQNNDFSPSAPPRWTLAGAILCSPGAFPAPRRRSQSVRNYLKTRLKWTCAISGRRLTNHERRQAQNL